MTHDHLIALSGELTEGEEAVFETVRTLLDELTDKLAPRLALRAAFAAGLELGRKLAKHEEHKP